MLSALIHLSLGPDERLGMLIVGFNKCIDVMPELFDRREGRTVQRLFSKMENRKPWRQQPGGHPQHAASVRGIGGRSRPAAICCMADAVRSRAFVRRKVEEELCYVATEALFEGKASE
jgi:hypothetical protein